MPIFSIGVRRNQASTALRRSPATGPISQTRAPPDKFWVMWWQRNSIPVWAYSRPRATPRPKFQTASEGILLILCEIAQNSIARYWQQREKLVGPGLQRRGLGDLLKDRAGGVGPHGIGHACSAGQCFQQRRKTMHWKSFCCFPCSLFFLRRFRGCCRKNRIASFSFLRQLLVFE